MSRRARGVLGRLVSDPPSPWLAVPVGFCLAVLLPAAFGADLSLVPFALFVAAVTVIGVVTSRSVDLGEWLGLCLLALAPAVIVLGALGFAAREVARPGRPSTVLLVMLLAVAFSNGVLCGYFVSLIVRFQRAMRASNEATAGQT